MIVVDDFDFSAEARQMAVGSTPNVSISVDPIRGLTASDRATLAVKPQAKH